MIHKFYTREYLEKQKKYFAEYLAFIDLQIKELPLSETDKFKPPSGFWGNLLASLLLWKNFMHYRRNWVMVFLGISAVVLIYFLQYYFNFFEFMHFPHSSVEEPSININVPQKEGVFSRIRQFVNSLRNYISKIIRAVLLVGAGAFGNSVYDKFYNESEAVSFDQRNPETASENIEAVPEAAPDASTSIPTNVDAATQIGSALLNHDLLELEARADASQILRLLDAPSGEHPNRASSVLLYKIDNLNKVSEIKELNSLYPDKTKENISRLVKRFLLELKERNPDSSFLCSDGASMLDLDNDLDILNKAGDALGGASSSTSQNKFFLNSSDMTNNSD